MSEELKTCEGIHRIPYVWTTMLDPWRMMDRCSQSMSMEVSFQSIHLCLLAYYLFSVIYCSVFFSLTVKRCSHYLPQTRMRPNKTGIVCFFASMCLCHTRQQPQYNFINVLEFTHRVKRNHKGVKVSGKC